MPEVTVQIARAEYPCGLGPKGCTIQPGEKYMRETIRPWDLIADDVDDEGRTIASPAGEWQHLRYKTSCYNSMMEGGGHLGW